MFNIHGRKVASKWKKTSVLLNDLVIAKYIPETRKFTQEEMEEMLSQYKILVVKPMIGSGGQGIIKITSREEDFLLSFYDHRQQLATIEELYTAIKKIKKNKQYIIQQGIDLAMIKGRPIDYRVKIQKPNNKWIITGMVGRWARRGYFITNLCKGGTRLTLTQGIKRSLPQQNYKAIRQRMRFLTRRGTRLLEQHFPGIRKLGFDYGVDRDGHIWIFEVNTNPG